MLQSYQKLFQVVWPGLARPCPSHTACNQGSFAPYRAICRKTFLNALYKPFKRHWSVGSIKALRRGALCRISFAFFQMTNRTTILECQSYRLRYRLREEESLGFLWNLQKYVQGNPKQTGTFEMLKLTEKCLE